MSMSKEMMINKMQTIQTMPMKDTMDFAYATVVGVLKEIQNEVTTLAHVYDSRDYFGVAYGKFAEKVNGIIEEYIEK